MCVCRYNVEPSEVLSASDQETFEINIVIPIRLRYIILACYKVVATVSIVEVFVSHAGSSILLECG